MKYIKSNNEYYEVNHKVDKDKILNDLQIHLDSLVEKEKKKIDEIKEKFKVDKKQTQDQINELKSL